MYTLKDLQSMKVEELKKVVKEFELDNVDIKDKNALFFNVLNAQASANGKLFAEGVIEIHTEGYGFLRFQEYSYLSSSEDIYVSPSQVNKFDLRTGDTVSGSVRPPKGGEKYFALLTVEGINSDDPESVLKMRRNKKFEKLTPLYPDEKINLETTPDNLSGRMGYIMNVVTIPAYRRTGIARRVMQAILHWLSEQGIRRVTLYATEMGRPLYQELGFAAGNEMVLRM